MLSDRTVVAMHLLHDCLCQVKVLQLDEQETGEEVKKDGKYVKDRSVTVQ